MRKKALKGLAVAAALTLSLTACGGGSTSGKDASKGASGSQQNSPSSFNQQPYSALKDGGELRMAIGEITPQLNAMHANMTTDTSTIWRWYNPEPLKFTPEGDLRLNENYITDLKNEVKDGKTVLTYTLNDKAVFNDGTPFDWKAFEATWKAQNGTDTAYEVNSTDGYTQIESVAKGANDKQVVVTFKVEYPWTGGVFQRILHPAVATADQFNTAYVGGTLAAAHPEWGAGPYKLSAVDEANGTMTFVKNEKWWGNPGKLDKVTLRVMQDSASINAFKNGEIDVTGARTKERLEQVKQMGDKVTIYKGQRTANYLLTLNSKSPILSDIKVREAIANGVDRAQIQTVLFNGLDGYTEQPTGSLHQFTYQKGYQDNYSKVVEKVDPEKAGKILEEDGWVAGSDGIREKNGQKLTLRIPLFGDNPTSKAMYQAMQSQLKKSGIDLQIDSRPSSEFSTVIKNRDFDILMSGFSSTDPYGAAYFCQTWCSDSTLNKSATGTPEFDKKIHEELETIGNADEQIKKANELEVEAFKQFGLIPVYSGPDIYAVTAGLANVGAGLFAGNGSAISDFTENIGFVK